MLDTDKIYGYYIALYNSVILGDNTYFERYNINEEEAYRYINLFVQNDSYLTSKEGREKLFNFADALFRYRLLEDRVLYLSYDLNKKDTKEYIKDNSEKLNEIISEMYLKTKVYENLEVKNLPKLSHEDLDKYFEEFLLLIDPDREFLNDYRQLLRQNKIVYLDEKSDEYKENIYKKYNIKDRSNVNFFVVDPDDDYHLYYTRNGDISDFRCLIHEFIHFLTYCYRNSKCNPVMKEFPSIFYELLGNVFLQNKGYSSIDTAKCSALRYKDTFYSVYMYGLFKYYVDMYNENGSLSREEDVDRRNNQILNYIDMVGNEKFSEDLKQDEDADNPLILADEFSKKAINLSYVYPDVLLEGYCYGVGTYLADGFLKKIINKEEKLEYVLEYMNYITRNLSDRIDIDDKIEVVKGKKLIKKRV